ncbi:dihydroneopterin aldolase [Brevundimonas sp.]|uniref:dihydroneopterin aldolase n=1 Tax=Brevundimonas sp. TaxID=1871086 RepID=UPI0025FF7A79|nr:dihydroneopterin aldolase [Brevundimonas sp.]
MSLPRPTPVSEPVAEGLTVFVRGLEVEAAIGVHDHELGRTQPLVLDVELQLAPRSVRRLEDTYNYEGVVEAARALLAEGHIGLVETFAERLAEALMADHRIRRCRVAVAKSEALKDARAAGCEVVLVR